MGLRKDEGIHGVSTMAISSGTMFRVIFMAGAVVFLYVIRDVMAMLLLALLLAALIDPFADALNRWRIPRALAVMAVYFFGCVVVLGVAMLVVPPMVEQANELTTMFMPLFANAAGTLHVDVLLTGAWSANIADVLSTIRASGVAGALPKIAAFGTSAVDFFFRAVIILILAFYCVVEKDVMVRGLGAIAPPEYQPFVTRLAGKARERMGVWLRGQLLLMLSIFILIYGALLLLNVPYALILAVLAGVMEIVPFVGPILSAAPAIFFALTISPWHAFFTLLAYLVIQQIEGNVLVPKIMQKVAGVSPVVSVLAVLIGWRVGGVVGAVVSIPLAMMLAVFLSEVFSQRESL